MNLPTRYQAIFIAPFAALGIHTEQGRLVGIDFLPADTPAQSPQESLAQQVCAQLAAYFTDPTFIFDLPLESGGTPFQQRVWQALSKIAPGQTISYGELARHIGSAPRAVGQACGANPIPIIVPCHRVVAKNGLGGFMNHRAGGPLDTKRRLLLHERGGNR